MLGSVHHTDVSTIRMKMSSINVEAHKFGIEVFVV